MVSGEYVPKPPVKPVIRSGVVSPVKSDTEYLDIRLEPGTLAELMHRTKVPYEIPNVPESLETLARCPWDEVDDKMRDVIQKSGFDGVIHYRRVPYVELRSDGNGYTLYYGRGVPVRRTKGNVGFTLEEHV